MDLELMQVIADWGVDGAIVVLTMFLSYIFINYMKQRDAAMMEYIDKRDSVVTDIHSKCEEKLTAITQNVINGLGECTSAIHELKTEVRVNTAKCVGQRPRT